MKIKYFEINDDLIKNNLIEFANASKYLLYNENPALLEKLDMENDIFYFKTIPVKPKLNYGIGSGFFNQNNKKDGIWDEDG